MVSREQAVAAAWKLFVASVPASEVGQVEVKLIDATWSVLFHKPPHPEYVEVPGFWLILVSADGQAEWFDVL